MSNQSIGVAVIGAGMAGKAHAAAYRQATAVFGPGLPPVDLVRWLTPTSPCPPKRPAGSAINGTTPHGRPSPMPTTSTS
ncbi:hypothetical protein GOHSU_25_00230 [Gordonia hirsuta DSM 44140 = NBRC 16056]|uniref:Uncharacterized protein n=1 Tax=Gordonia hirsuta DSM 44140 = NBRC 16056 TaxID=1121927 RepID=L7LCL8_9ACTN|nr:hypothetical protein GOHSU_25_00230 [Gordonia hirsuta DSM 44140 = NBRC 16056]